MSSLKQNITLYTSKACPFAQRVEISLAEANASFIRVEIDLHDKPEWYLEKVNSAGKVPSLAYGSSAPSKDGPLGPDTAILTESLVLAEFVADLHPSAQLIPVCPLKRARMRLFIDALPSLVSAWFAFHRAYGTVERLHDGIARVQDLLPAGDEEGLGYAVGEYSLADVAITPFLARMRASIGNDWGTFPEGEGKRVWADMNDKQGKYARFARYVERLLQRESFKKTLDEEFVTEFNRKALENLPRVKP